MLDMQEQQESSTEKWLLINPQQRLSTPARLDSIHVPWTSKDILLLLYSKPFCLRQPGQECTWIREESLGIQADQIQSFGYVGTGGYMSRDMVEVT